METTTVAPITSAAAPQPARGFDALGGDSFFKLLIAQLANQDPLEPTSNQELLQQISSIRDIELSSAMTQSLQGLVDQSRRANGVGSSAALMGQYVIGAPGQDGTATAGVVVGVRFAADGAAVLLIEGGGELPIEQVQSVMPARQAAERLIGQRVSGIDQTDPASPALVEGVVTGVSTEGPDELVLELDTGETLRLGAVMGVGESAAVQVGQA